MSSEIAYLKTTLNEKQKQEDQLHRALEDSTMLESSMRGEIEQQHLHTEELELEVQNLQVLCLTLVTGILALSFHLCLLSICFAVRNLSLPILEMREADQNFKTSNINCRKSFRLRMWRTLLGRCVIIWRSRIWSMLSRNSASN
jgi:hypothetical protein